MKVAMGSDHGGFKLKKDIINFLIERKIEFQDFGTYSEVSCDYSDYALAVSEEVVSGKFDFGILICGTGIGIGIAANKVMGVRAALCHDTFSAHASREHNDANILTLGERVIGPGLALDIVDIFLNTKFSKEERHQNRINKISKIEKNNLSGGK